MTQLLVIGGLILVAVAIGGFAVWAIKYSSYAQGVAEESNAEQAVADKAKDKANTVLAEHRDPDDAASRLRNHDF